MQKRAANHFFNFTKKEKNGTIFLLLIIFLLIATPFVYSFFFEEKNIDAAVFNNEMVSLKLQANDSNKKKSDRNDPEDPYKKIYPRHESNNDNNRLNLFYFDPNNLSEAGWKKLGIRDKTIATIQNYLSKGGKFKQAEDIKKIWGLHEDEVSQMLPYIRIEQTTVSASPHFPVYEKKEYPKTTIPVIDINIADSSAYISLPGIGPGYARRILKFRDRLGGFYKIEQVSETFGFPDSTYQKIKNYLQVSSENTRKININTASLDELKDHPYIRYQIANAIIEYRTQHGNFESVDDIKKIMLVSNETFVKVEPYLTVK